ncbi:MAG: diacylglycerol kinase [Actinobacteria bacterium HGW-Actinobacteria-7]|nr:MAG: diacylglycerol kinase [Actinobacteria bacterium HGW-Actinobacteria-7]
MRVLAIVNSRAGGSDEGLYDLIRIAGARGVEFVLRFVADGVRIEDLLADVTDFDRVVAAGGDGTVSAVAYTVRNTKVPVLVYPAGTANLLALNLGIPLDSADLANLLIDGCAAQFDLGEIEMAYPDGTSTKSGFTVMAGAGYDAQIMDAAQPMKPTFGAAAYLMAAIGNIAPTSARFELVLDGKHVSTEGIAVLLVNFGRIQFELDVTRDWNPQDGFLAVTVVRTKTAAGLLPVLFGAMMDRLGDTPDRNSGIDTYRVKRAEISAYPPLKIQYDGEAMDLLTPFAAQVLPGAATLLVPRGSEYAEPR